MLELDAIGQSWGERPVLESVSLQLAQGEIGCLLGPSGCGKTTALRLIAGLEPLQRGRIAINARTLSGAGMHIPAEQRQIGMVFQDYALFPHLTAAENIAFGLTGLDGNARKQRVEAMLALVDLATLGQRYPHQLSGGQQQRVALARALAPAPSLLLMDEPFSNLDVTLREKLSLEVRDILKRAGTTTLLVTHDQQEAFAVADQVGVLHEGRLQQWSTPYRLYHEPANRFVAGFIGEGVLLPGTLRARCEVETAFGLLQAAAGPACSLDTPGSTVDVLLRPDDIVHDDESPLTAVVLARRFRGSHYLYTLQLSDGKHVESLVPSHHDHAIGEAIGIRLEADHLIVFPAERNTRQ